MSEICMVCDGRGYVIEESKSVTCKYCNGTGLIKTTEENEVHKDNERS